MGTDSEELYRQEGCGAHGERHIEISCGWSHERHVVLTNKDGAHARQQAGEVCEDDKDKEARNQGENCSPELLASGCFYKVEQVSDDKLDCCAEASTGPRIFCNSHGCNSAH